MKGERGFRIAGVGLRVEACGHARPAAAEYRPFVAEEAEPGVRIFARAEPWPGLRNGAWGRLLFDAEGTWSLHERAGGRLFTPYSPGSPDGRGGEAEISPDFRRVTVFGLPAGAPVLAYPLDEVLFLHLLPDLGGVLLHASAMLWRERALLFLGPSGAGKTTISLLWQQVRGVSVLSDDRVALRPRDGAIWASGTPWHGTGKRASARSAPVGGVYLLAKSTRNRLRPPEPGEALEGLFRASFLPHWDAPRVCSGLAALEALVAAVPPQVAEFRPEAAAVEELWP